MNIGILTTWFERGAAYVSRAYMETFAAASHDVFIYARAGERSGRGCPCWDLPCVTWAPRLRYCNGGAVYDLNHLTRWLRQRRIDVVLFNEERNWDVVRLCKALGYTVGAYVDYYTAATVRLFDAYDFLVCNTRRHYSVFADHPHCFFVPWGTDVELFKPAASDESGPVRFFHNAGLSPFRKGTDLVLKAFRQVAGEAQLIIHAQKPIGGLQREIGLPDDRRVNVLHRTVPAPGLYHLGNVYVYPSRLDGIGLTVCEALACGLPVITTDSAPMNEFVADGRNGLLVPVAVEEQRWDGYYWPMATADVEALAARMQQYVDEPSRIDAHAQHARESAVRQFCWRRNSAALANQIAAIVENTQKKRPRLARRAAWAAAAAIARVRAGFISAAKGVFGDHLRQRARTRFRRGAATRSEPSPPFPQAPGKRNTRCHITQ